MEISLPFEALLKDDRTTKEQQVAAANHLRVFVANVLDDNADIAPERHFHKSTTSVRGMYVVQGNITDLSREPSSLYIKEIRTIDGHTHPELVYRVDGDTEGVNYGAATDAYYRVDRTLVSFGPLIRAVTERIEAINDSVPHDSSPIVSSFIFRHIPIGVDEMQSVTQTASELITAAAGDELNGLQLMSEQAYLDMTVQRLYPEG